VENKNIKRESKAYSYKEQMMEIELRKELEEKKKLKDTGGAEGPGGDKVSRMPTNLTKKQKETIDQELQKEAAIRTKMKEVSNSSMWIKFDADLIESQMRRLGSNGLHAFKVDVLPFIRIFWVKLL